MKRIFSISLGIFFGLAGVGHAEKASLADISAHLNSLRSIQATFVQIGADGSSAQGQFFMKRPGRLRFEYQIPSEVLVLVYAGQMAIFDPKGDGEPTSFTTSGTPLSLILQDRIDLQKSALITDHRYDGKRTSLSLQHPQHPERGEITLVLRHNPLELAQWIIETPEGDQTLLALEDLQKGVSLKDSVFNILLNIEKRKLR